MERDLTREPEYYQMSSERAEAVATAAGLTTEQVRQYCLADWSEGDEHQQWLDSAPVEEIADWIKAGRR